MKRIWKVVACYEMLLGNFLGRTEEGTIHLGEHWRSAVLNPGPPAYEIGSLCYIMTFLRMAVKSLRCVVSL